MTDLVRYTAIVNGLNVGMVVLGIIFMFLVAVAIFSNVKKIKERCITFGSITVAVWLVFLVASILIYGHVEELRTPIHTETSTTIIELEDPQTTLERLEAYTASKGKWEDAVHKPVIDTDHQTNGDVRVTHDVDDDGVGDFHIIYNREGKPVAWRGLDEYGKPYG